MTFKVTDAGILTTIQDLGRVGHQSVGISPAGVLDYKSAILANFLLNNDPNAAVLEFNLRGISFVVQKDITIATAGAPMKLTINEEVRSIGRAYSLSKGDFVSFGMTTEGMRTYLAVAGGFKVDDVLGSSSTHIRSNMGGFQGRALEVNDLLSYSGNNEIHFPLVVKEETAEKNNIIRIIEAPNYDSFTEESKMKLVDTQYEIGRSNDRMGIRLDGETLETRDGVHDVLSEPTQLGNIQVPKNGLPIILLSDRQTTGGYKRIASVIKVDLPKLVQLRPGEEIQFELVDLNTATELYKKEMQKILNKEYLNISSEFSDYRRVEADRIMELLMR